jgi:PAS domain S-box-containing protein
LRPRWLPYFIALLAVCAALGIRSGLDPWLGERVPYITLFGAVIVAAWYGGAGPALFAAVTAWAAAQWLFITPSGRLLAAGVPGAIELVAYAISSLLIAGLGGAMQAARRRSAESEARFRAFMQNSPHAVFLKDEAGRYVFMNPAAQALTGAAGWLGKTDEELLPQAAAAEVRAHDRRVLEGDAPQLYDLRFGGRTLQSVKFPLRDAAGRRFIGSITMDVTDQRAAAVALRAADRRKDQFIATLAHELRNPLAPIRSAVSILERHDVAEADRAWSRDVIARQVMHMARLVDDLLDVARITSGKLLLRKERVTLGAVVGAALETSRPTLDAFRHRLAALTPAADAVIEADPTRLAQVVSNLLDNAAKYTPPGGAIELRAERAGNEALISVADNGIGFAPELAERLFEPFAQWAPAGQAATGLGIGLSLVRGVVELHGGSVRAASEGPGKGSRFEVRLPLAAAPAEGAARAPEPAPGARGGMRVLVADDNRDAADTLCRVLSLYGYEVRAAYDGNAALEICESFEPQAAVLDLGMPLRSGYDVARELRARRGPGMRLIALTGWGGENDARRAREAGFDHHLTKPADPAALSELLSPRSASA